MKVSDMSLQGQREFRNMMKVIPFGVCLLLVLLVVDFLFDGGAMIVLNISILALVLSLPALLYGLDRLEQRYPGLYPYFNFKLRKLRRDNGGQISILGIITAFLTIVVYFSLIPSINAVIDEQLPNLGTVEASLVRLIHVVFIGVILGTIVIYSRQE